MLSWFTNISYVSKNRRFIVYEMIVDMTLPRRSYYAMAALSAIIASYGLLLNSTAVVIGAMLVAPLMGPIFGIALGLKDGDWKLLWHGILAETVGVLIAISIAIIIGLMSYNIAFNNEIISRTHPTLFDLFIALAAGLAGAYALINERISPILPGVAVATALLPPLASCGICIAKGNWEYALGAFLLFIANLIAIQLVAAFIFGLFGISSNIDDVPLSWKHYIKRFALSIITIIVVSCYLTLTLNNLILDEKLKRNLELTLSREVGATMGARLSDVRYKKQAQVIDVVATIMTPKEFEAPQVNEIEKKLQSEVYKNIKLVMRSLISSDMDSKGPVFMLEQDRFDIEEAEQKAQFLTTASQVLENEINKIPGAHIVNISRDDENDKTTVTLVIRTPDPMRPDQIGIAEKRLRRVIGSPVSLIVRSVYTREANSTCYLTGTPEPDTQMNALFMALRKGLSNQISKTIPGAVLVDCSFKQENKRIIINATVQTPKSFEPVHVRLIQDLLRKYTYQNTDLFIQFNVGALTSADNYITDLKTLNPNPWLDN